MGQTPETLNRLVKLKRQGAEQKVAKIQNLIATVERDINAKQQSLLALDESAAAGESYSHRSTFIEVTLRQVTQLQARRAQLHTHLKAAQRAFQKAIYSEERLDEMQATNGLR